MLAVTIKKMNGQIIQKVLNNDIKKFSKKRFIILKYIKQNLYKSFLN